MRFNTDNEIDSPCVSNCILYNRYCLGCGRTRREITRWRDASNEEKLQIIGRIKDLNRERAEKIQKNILALIK